MKKKSQNRLIALDFDGVVIDSIEECYKISKQVFYGFYQFPFNAEEYKNLFFKYRGLVGPAHEYFIIHKLLFESITNGLEPTVQNFDQLKNSINQLKLSLFESLFFYTRTYYQKLNFEHWVMLNPLTNFGKSLIKRDNSDIYIVTTKNRFATESLLNFYNISVKEVYTNDEVKAFGSKGLLISNLLDTKKINEAYFLDDSTNHLDTVNDKRIKCYFVPWGYGQNKPESPYDLAENKI